MLQNRQDRQSDVVVFWACVFCQFETRALEAVYTSTTARGEGGGFCVSNSGRPRPYIGRLQQAQTHDDDISLLI